jgi:hypothetical protein
MFHNFKCIWPFTRAHPVLGQPFRQVLHKGREPHPWGRSKFLLGSCHNLGVKGLMLMLSELFQP